MADRRTDETPLAPRRPLGRSSEGQGTSAGRAGGQSSGGTQSSAQSSTQSSDQKSQDSKPQGGKPGRESQSGSAAGSGSSSGSGSAASTSRPPLSDRVSAAVASAASKAPTLGKSGHDSDADTLTQGKPAKASRSGLGRTRTRKARLRLTHVDPWSVMKTSFLLAIAFGIVTVISVAVVWSVLGAAGVWESINATVQEVLGGESGAAFDIEDYVGTSRVLGFTMIVAVVDVVLITAIATLGAFLYNLAATLLGGLEVTWAEDER